MPNTKPASIRLQQRGELPLLHVENAHATALIALQGGQILTYTPTGQRPLLWLSERAEFKRGQSLRGGIPVCWPWFGDMRRNPDTVQKMVAAGANVAAHGFARALDWQIQAIAENDATTDIVLGLTLSNSLAPTLWPHAAELQLTIRVGKSLHITLSTRNLDTQPLALTQAFHTYFAISGIDNVAASGFDHCRYIDTLDQWREHEQHGDILFDAETDRIYLGTPSEMQLHDAIWRRTIHLRARNSTSAVVWNPWIEKSKHLSQFATDAWQRMTCIETANVLDDMRVLAPDAEHSMELELWAEQA